MAALVLIAVGFLAAWTVLGLSTYERFRSPSWDLAIFTEAVKSYAHLHSPTADIKGAGFNLLGDHFSPVVALLAPLWWIFPSAVMLLVAQAALFAASVVVVGDTAGRLTDRRTGIVAAVAYGLSFGLQNAVAVEFHEIAFAVPIMAVVTRQLALKQWNRAVWWSLPLLLVKEDLGLTVAMVGILLILARRLTSGVFLTWFGIIAAAFTVDFVIPHFAAGHQYPYFNELAGGAAHPHWGHLLLSLVWPPVKWRTLAWTFGITGFIALRSPVALLTVPTLLWRFTASNTGYWQTTWHYSAVLMPVVFIAAADGLRRIGRSPGTWRRLCTRLAVPLMLAAAVALTAARPLEMAKLFHPATYRRNVHEQALAQAAASIPPGVAVETGNPLLARLASRDTVYWSGGDRAGPPWIVFDLQWWSPGTDPVTYAQNNHPGATYKVTFDRNQVVVLKRAN